jgi:hypothetical protein
MAPKLFNVTGMKIKNEDPKSGSVNEVALELPSLERANKLEIYGVNTKRYSSFIAYRSTRTDQSTSVSLPKLKMIGTSFLFNITPALELELPALKITNTTTLVTQSSYVRIQQCGCSWSYLMSSSLSLPSLERSSGLLSINLRKAAKITLPALYYAENVDVSGRITEWVAC